MTLNNGYDKQNLLFRKFNNKKLNILNHKVYYASIFINLINLTNKNTNIQEKVNANANNPK